MRKKTLCMNFCPRDKSECLTGVFPLFTLFGQTLEFVPEFCYLGHIINDLLSGDNDISREIRNMFVRMNMLIRRFGRCSRVVKTRLFQTYCACLCDVGQRCGPFILQHPCVGLDPAIINA
jgi:hypothetical protein